MTHWWHPSTWDLPPVSRQIRNESMVPKAQFAALGPLPRTFDMIENPRHFRAGEIGIKQQPGFCGEKFFMSLRLSASAQISAVRRSCQTMALWMALPVLRSHTTVVSRWLVMPMAADILAARSLPWLWQPGRWPAPISRFLPGHARPSPNCGKYCLNSFWAEALGLSFASKTMARDEVVP